MSRFLARSAMFDAVCRFCNMVLFVLLLPVVLILSRRRESDLLIPVAPPIAPLPRHRHSLPKAT